MKKIVLYSAVFMLFGSFAQTAEYKAVDGDSLMLEERRLRLDGIDAPEFTQSCFDAAGAEYLCGLKSLKYLESLMTDSVVKCDCLPEPDIYNREVCECFADEVSLNRAMVYAGYAMTYRSEKYADAEQNAKSAKRGMWQGKFMRPALFRALERVRHSEK